MSSAKEVYFQNDIIKQLIANGWLLGQPSGYNRKLALYEEDLLGFDDRFQYSLSILTVLIRAVFHQTMMVKA
ncbi:MULTISPECIES: hypothetical protein [unclassified Oceanobacter]|uniref:hypothetical protein n=1 Tax=unclassified Oceanobacter TaxID=2620260 RepID=UPI0027329860|nr:MULTISPECIES: hypothetical protein [unclassified Oceanobacter]MDP2506143.1 hypothetical protein [Oceanobacter sp. 3_MG-2023]MDP2607440.1 hypothetical protein [Oceanobacter sp. 1_MG-2023]MDP2610708.1 hypothetical protein [Oceanobacter sp. 2_MG-2023]